MSNPYLITSLSHDPKPADHVKEKRSLCCCTSVFSHWGQKFLSLLSSVGCAITDLGKSILSKIYSPAPSLEGRAQVIPTERNLDRRVIHDVALEDVLNGEPLSPMEIEEEVPLSDKIKWHKAEICSLIAKNCEILRGLKALGWLFLPDDTRFANEWARNTIFAEGNADLDADTFFENLEGIRDGLKTLTEDLPSELSIKKIQCGLISDSITRLKANQEALTKLLRVLSND